MQLTIAIISGGRETLLQRCLESLSSVAASKIIVTTLPGLKPATRALLSDQDRLILNTRMNAAEQRNLALRFCSSSLIYFLDEDCYLLNPSLLSQLPIVFARNKNCIAMGGGYVSSSSTSLPTRIYNHMTNLWLECLQGRSLVGGNMILNRQRLPAGCEFNVATCFGGEETELFQRLQAFGFSFQLDRRLDVIHNPAHGWRSLLSRSQAQSRGPSYQQLGGSVLKSSQSAVRSPFLTLGALLYVGSVWLQRKIRPRSSREAPHG